MVINQLEVKIGPELDSALSDFCVLALGDDEDAPSASIVDAVMDVITDIVSPDICVIPGTNKISKYDYHNISILFILTKYV